MALKIKTFLEGLELEGLIQRDEVEVLSDEYAKDPAGLITALINKDLVPHEEMALRWSNFLDIPWVDLSKTIFQPDIVERLSKDYCDEHNCIPIYRMGDATTVAMLDPTDLDLITNIEYMIEDHVSPVFSTASEIKDALAIQFNSTDSVANLVDRIDLSEFSADKHYSQVQVEKITRRKSIVELARTILLWGIKEGASDIHIEPGEFKVSIRFRIDGVMQRKMDVQLSLLAPLNARLKVLANVDLMERRRPQDGRISLKLENESFEFRLSTVPTIYGEKSVLRILGNINNREVPSLEEIDLSARHLRTLRHVLKAPNGIFFVTGPTGSGKSTTLFAMLRSLDKTHLNIVTVENPVEYRLPGINQIEINPEINLTFGSVLRAILRQDPDVILLGEIRDADSAKVAAEAALTGHLVMSTLHTNDAIQAVTRLVEIGVEPFLVAPAIIGVVAQRLARRLCTDCRERYQLDRDTVDYLFDKGPDEVVFMYRARGCPRCNHAGYKGRIAIHEVLMIDDDMRSMIARDQSILDMRAAIERKGFDYMRYDGIKKALRGLTSLEEINRCTLSEFDE